ncbi:hypothetical protein [Bacillus pumilus]|uniref:hypothetical protein n=1 Tax=Bacillus pumilus TaxID=1408 RepID=UPI000B94D320|nr:hypothetical protein [Bacillus pumilus]MCR4352181.1 hypothetical protein [Bacillus pumilus]MCY7503992.1 hypothetical protein [Bacillus pumilus]MED4724277.1 hypothetical protein [Bacillus pumilus]MED4744449.1 hypothetical protein [Bacillus pumilus]SNV11477.1 Uncharacterised protein [Bacillus pumilus]
MRYVCAVVALVGFITWLDCFKPSIIESFTVFLTIEAAMLAVVFAALKEESQ